MAEKLDDAGVVARATTASADTNHPTDSDGAGLRKSTIDEVFERHKIEKKQMQDEITVMRKSVPLSQRKQRRQILLTVTEEMETEMRVRHQTEIEEFELQLDALTQSVSAAALTDTGDKSVNACEADEINGTVSSTATTNGDSANAEFNSVHSKADPCANYANEPDDEDNIDSASTGQKQHQRVSKAQRRREKKSAKAVETAARIKFETEELKKTSPRERERSQIAERLRQRNLRMHDVRSDGDCLFCAVGHQLELRGVGADGSGDRISSVDLSVQSLRRKAADYILKQADDFLPFMVDEQSGEPMNHKTLAQYCERISSTKAWGGDAELWALSDVFHVPIYVIGPTADIVIGEQHAGAANKPLLITFHKHEMSTGEHYNSTCPV